ncbi:MAG: glycosyltransferase family 4 protein [Anaerolineae bacterium]|nr:glycosyltransferase family 4 protein [Anaerolineae bacterium]
MRIGILLPGFSAHADDWAIPVQQNLARELAARADLRIIALRYPYRRDTYRLNGATVHSLGAGQARGLRRLALWWDALRLIEWLHREAPFDVLHAMWADETGLIAGWAGRRLGVPVVVSILGGELVGLRDIGYGLQRGAFSRWIVGQALASGDRVIVPGSYVRRLIDTAGYAVPDAKIVTLPLGVDAERFAPAAAPPKPNRLIHVASLVPVKDQATLLRALALLDSDVTLDVIGEGALRLRLEALARELGITERVRFVGAVAHPDLPAYYRQAAIHVLTSRHEAGAIAILEAAACGLPTVSTHVGTLPDHPSLGVVVPVGDAAAAARAIQILLADSPSRSALERSARAAAAGEFSIRATADRLMMLYTELTGKS